VPAVAGGSVTATCVARDPSVWLWLRLLVEQDGDRPSMSGDTSLEMVSPWCFGRLVRASDNNRCRSAGLLWLSDLP